MNKLDAFTGLRKDVAEIKALLPTLLRINDTTLTKEEAAKYLGIPTVKTLMNKVSEKKINCCRHGKCVVFYKSELDRYLESHRV